MKKEIITYYCDECGKEYKETNLFSFTIKYFYNKKMDLCYKCICERLSHSFSLVEDRVCIECNGTGRIKEWTGVGHDYDYRPCAKCHQGLIDL